MDDLVRIRYWQQETMESGGWCVTEPILRKAAEAIMKHSIEMRIYERGEIIEADLDA